MVLNNESFAVKLVESAITKDQKTYYKLVLADRTGEIKAQIWSDNIPNIERSSLIPGNVILVNAMVEEYKGALQLNILKAVKAPEAQLSEYMEASDFDLDQLWKVLEKYISDIKDERIMRFLKELFDDKDTAVRFKNYPAAEYVIMLSKGDYWNIGLRCWT